MSAIWCGNCKGTHPSVEGVKNCYAHGATSQLPVPQHKWDAAVNTARGYGTFESNAKLLQETDLLPCEAKAIATGKVAAQVFTQDAITPKQEAFLNSLLSERPALRSVENLFPENVAKLTKADASATIERVKATAKEVGKDGMPVQEVPTIEDGIYLKGTEYVLVYHTVHGQNIQVGKVLIITDNGDGTFSGEWDYRGRNILKGMDASMKLSEEAARKFGQIYGICVRCAAKLTRDESKHVGYGKTCAGHEGWFYPTKAELRALNTKAGV